MGCIIQQTYLNIKTRISSAMVLFPSAVTWHSSVNMVFELAKRPVRLWQ